MMGETKARVRIGELADGRAVHRCLLRGGGLEAEVLDFGGILAALRVPTRGGVRNVVLGFDTLADYLRHHPYLGTLIGRYANRIAHGRFTLDGVTHRLPVGPDGHHLHGGPQGFHRALWTIAEQGPDTLSLRHFSPDGDQGYPGNLHVTVRYTLTAERALCIDYEASCDRATVVNFTHHAYFNLGGEPGGTVHDHRLELAADRYTPTDEHLIPTGEIAPVAGTPLDFTRPRAIGEGLVRLEAGYDHNYVLGEAMAAAPRYAGRLTAPDGATTMEVWTTEPGLQLYTANFLHLDSPFPRHGAVCLETQHFPDSPNRPQFPSTVLRPGALFRSRTLYRFV